MTDEKKRCHICAAVHLGGAGWKTMVKIDPVTRARAEEHRCPKCDSRARIGLGIHAKPEGLDKARKRGTANSSATKKRGRPRIHDVSGPHSIGGGWQ